MKIIKWHYLLAALIIIFDQVTKYIVAASMRVGESFEIVPSFLYLTSHRNEGAAFGILQGQRWFFILITIVVIAVVVYYLQQYGTLSFTFGIPLALVLGGAIGNFIDRILFGEVVDFILGKTEVSQAIIFALLSNKFGFKSSDSLGILNDNAVRFDRLVKSRALEITAFSISANLVSLFRY